jgi:hypothetical protein
MAMRFDGVAEPEIEYALGIDYEHEHRDAEHEHEEEPEKAMQMNASVGRFDLRRVSSWHSVNAAVRRWRWSPCPRASNLT